MALGLVGMVAAVSGMVSAQEEPPPPKVSGVRVISGGEGGVVVQSLSGEEIGGAIAIAQAVEGAPGVSFAMMPAMNDDPASLLNLDQIQQELELIDPQVEKIRELQSDLRKRQADLMRNMAKDGLRQPDVMAAIQDELKEMRETTRAEIEKLLLPHQADRLRQIALQAKLQRRGTANGLMGDELAEALELTDSQKDRLRERAKEIEQELQREIARLRQKAEEQIVAELTPAQRGKLEQMLGKRIEIKTPAFRAPAKNTGAASGAK
ncbi:MAG: hypothetical protein FJ297_14095 [Planctomycetes bacterium]|nr:hypothetical protein [Planctomycetota bacterium]